MADAPKSNRRKFYRLRYPIMARPQFRTGKHEFAVAELSESGMRVVADDLTLSRGIAISGDVRFADGVVCGVLGKVLRYEGDEAILKLEMGLPLRRMLAEQQWVIRTYPMYRPDELSLASEDLE
jgi:PilZ domain